MASRMGQVAMMTWNQNYDPLNQWVFSTLLSSLPVVTLFFVLLYLRRPVWQSALSGMVMAVLIASLAFQMPASLIAAASVNGFLFGFFRIAWLIIASLFLYQIAVETGQFDLMKKSIAGLSSDRRIQVVLIAFCFGAFLEGTGGGGAPVAIAGSFLIGLGVRPFQAATLCLLANTAPVAWGGVGNPIRVLNGVYRSSHRRSQRDGGPDPSSIFLDIAHLVDRHHGRLASSDGGFACTAGCRRFLCRDAVLLVQLSGGRTRRHRLRHLFPSRNRWISQGLASS